MSEIAAMARALPDEDLVRMLSPAAVRRLPDAILEGLFSDEPPTAAAPAGRTRKPKVEATDADVYRVGASIAEQDGSIATLATRLDMSADLVRACVARLTELGLVRRRGVGRNTTYEKLEEGAATPIA